MEYPLQDFQTEVREILKAHCLRRPSDFRAEIHTMISTDEDQQTDELIIMSSYEENTAVN